MLVSMKQRLTRTESVGLEPSPPEKLQEAWRTFAEGRDDVQQRRREMLASGPLRPEEAEDLFRDEIYYDYDQALADVIGDLAYTLARNGRDSSEAVAAFGEEVAAVRTERNAAIKNGWAYKSHKRELATRELLWERELKALRRQLGLPSSSLVSRLLGH
jgi:hypothetical protein